ncbi:hypothetical protein ACH429_01365 [Streptomyces pathocidini]|uniref:Uncharacterized protein n=1 Tax=Streptomyces pathocidini TaxID=1650571 RepID=A0ABW7ULQ1_9ACTN|nr:hypothetical protein [Streptomyces pathocidini]
MTTQRHTVGKAREAEEARDALAVALERAGLRLPSLQVDAATYADAVPRPLVDLGRCPPSVALALAAVIEKGAA